jgi:LysR family nitrogen assimilation transcriptional regulator
MELRQLNYFLEVARSGSFSRASAVLGIAQPALSRQIRKLEEELGLDLLYRHGRGAALTDAGEKLRRGVEPVLGELSRVREEVVAERVVPRGIVTLGMPPALSAVLGAPLLRHCRERWPLVQLKIVDGFSGHVHEWLVAGRVDIAILYNARRARSIVTEQLLAEELFLIGPGTSTIEPAGRSGPVPLRTLDGMPLILPGQHHGLRRELDRAAAAAGVSLQVDLEVDGLDTIKELVMAGSGHAVLPFGGIHREVAEGRLTAHKLVDPEVTNIMVLAMSLRRSVTLAMRVLGRAIHDEIGALVAAGRLTGHL